MNLKIGHNISKVIGMFCLSLIIGCRADADPDPDISIDHVLHPEFVNGKFKSEFLDFNGIIDLENCPLIGKVDYVMEIENFIIVVDKMLGNIHVLDKKDQLIRTINHVGEGDKEYLEISSLIVNDQDNLIISDVKQARLISYSIEDRFIFSKKVDFISPTVQLVEGSSTLIFDNNYARATFDVPSKNKYGLYTYDYKIDEIKDRFVPVPKAWEGSSLALLKTINPIHHSHDWLYIRPYDNSFYVLNTVHSKVSSYNVALNNVNMMNLENGEVQLKPNQLKWHTHFGGLRTLYDAGDALFFTSHHNGKICFGLVEKPLSGDSKCIVYEDPQSDIFHEMFLPYPVNSTANGDLLFVMSMELFQMYLERRTSKLGITQDEVINGLSLDPEIVARIKEIKENKNPVIVKFKLKEGLL